jgi:2-iminobutanoate/2-iminopropanoate deaminase
MKTITTSDAPQAIGPYAQAIAANGLVFTSGQIPLTPASDKVEGGIARQTEQVFDNLDAILSGCGASLASVAKATVFMTDLGEFAAMNEVYARRFGDHRPARSTVQVAALPTGARVEIEVVAVLDR